MMAFKRTITVVETDQFDAALKTELTAYIACLNVRQLTRCGGHASDPNFVSVSSMTVNETSIKLECQITFSDGGTLDCSGHCGGTTTQRHEALLIHISRNTGSAVWETLDGVISG